MDYVLVENGVVKKVGLPKTGLLKNGCTVSGYDTLEQSVLLDEGWLPVIDNLPTYDPGLQTIQHDGYDISETQVTARYIVRSIADTVNLNALITNKIYELDKSCNAEILAGFYSVVKDGNRLYGLDYDDQLNMEALKNNVALGIIPDGTLEYYAKGMPCEPWSNAEFMTLYGQAMVFKTERIKTCKAKKELVKAATSIEELEGIVWAPLS